MTEIESAHANVNPASIESAEVVTLSTVDLNSVDLNNVVPMPLEPQYFSIETTGDRDYVG